MNQPYDIVETDILILGSGGAGQMAALRTSDASQKLQILMAVKGLHGKSGCTRMVQGGYNAVLNSKDSVEKHLRDTLAGGQWVNDQELAYLLVSQAPKILKIEG